VLSHQSGGIGITLSPAKLFDAYTPDWIAEEKAFWLLLED